MAELEDVNEGPFFPNAASRRCSVINKIGLLVRERRTTQIGQVKNGYPRIELAVFVASIALLWRCCASESLNITLLAGQVTGDSADADPAERQQCAGVHNGVCSVYGDGVPPP